MFESKRLQKGIIMQNDFFEITTSSYKTQTQKVLEHLKEYGSITTLEAFYRYNIVRLRFGNSYFKSKERIYKHNNNKGKITKREVLCKIYIT